jgi:hypothetical protein
MDDDKLLRAEQRAIDARREVNPQLKVQTSASHDGQRTFDVMTTMGEVSEEHVYLIYKSVLKEVVIEADLLGDQATYKSDGTLPPVVHIECPNCTSPQDRHALSITHGNKHFEIEDLEEKHWGVVTDADGRVLFNKRGEPVIVKRRLTVKETVQCPYCSKVFRITDNIMSDA